MKKNRFLVLSIQLLLLGFSCVFNDIKLIRILPALLLSLLLFVMIFGLFFKFILSGKRSLQANWIPMFCDTLFIVSLILSIYERRFEMSIILVPLFSMRTSIIFCAYKFNVRGRDT